MTDLERRALLGDAKAQRECTEKGIVLRCPCCGGTARQHGRFCISYIECDSCGLESCVMDENETDYDTVPFKCTIAYKVREKWNTRPAPPIGRCRECGAYTSEGPGVGHCNDGTGKTDDGYCDCFYPKGGKKWNST